MTTESIDLRSLFEKNQGLVFEHYLRTNSFMHHQLYIMFKDDFIEEIKDTVIHSADWYELINRVYVAQDWNKKRMAHIQKMEDMRGENKALIEKIAELECQILELSLSPDPGPLYMQAQANYNKSIEQLNGQKIDSNTQ